MVDNEERSLGKKSENLQVKVSPEDKSACEQILTEEIKRTGKDKGDVMVDILQQWRSLSRSQDENISPELRAKFKDQLNTLETAFRLIRRTGLQFMDSFVLLELDSEAKIKEMTEEKAAENRTAWARVAELEAKVADYAEKYKEAQQTVERQQKDHKSVVERLTNQIGNAESLLNSEKQLVASKQSEIESRDQQLVDLRASVAEQVQELKQYKELATENQRLNNDIARLQNEAKLSKTAHEQELENLRKSLDAERMAAVAAARSEAADHATKATEQRIREFFEQQLQEVRNREAEQRRSYRVTTESLADLLEKRRELEEALRRYVVIDSYADDKKLQSAKEIGFGDIEEFHQTLNQAKRDLAENDRALRKLTFAY